MKWEGGRGEEEQNNRERSPETKMNNKKKNYRRRKWMRSSDVSCYLSSLSTCDETTWLQAQPLQRKTSSSSAGDGDTADGWEDVSRWPVLPISNIKDCREWARAAVRPAADVSILTARSRGAYSAKWRWSDGWFDNTSLILHKLPVVWGSFLHLFLYEPFAVLNTAKCICTCLLNNPPPPHTHTHTK